MKMKFVFALLLVLLVAIWANPDYSESDNDDGSKSFAIVQTASRREALSRNHSESNDDGCRDVKTVQKATLKTEDVLHVNNDENQVATKLRRKRGIFRKLRFKKKNKGNRSKGKGEWEGEREGEKGERKEDVGGKGFFGGLFDGFSNNDNNNNNNNNDDSSGKSTSNEKGFSFFSSGSSSFNATRNVFIALVLLALQCMM